MVGEDCLNQFLRALHPATATLHVFLDVGWRSIFVSPHNDRNRSLIISCEVAARISPRNTAKTAAMSLIGSLYGVNNRRKWPARATPPPLSPPRDLFLPSKERSWATL